MSTQMMDIFLVISIFTSFFMCGLCWFVQIIHYPLFRNIDPKDFPEYERKNLRTAFIATPVMTAELVAGAILQYQLLSNGLFWIQSALLIIIWISTFAFQGPTHLKLTQSANPKLINFVIRTNWIRTISWTLRSGIFITILLNTIA